MNNFCIRTELAYKTGCAVIKTNACCNNYVCIVHGKVSRIRAVHSKHAYKRRRIIRNTAKPHKTCNKRQRIIIYKVLDTGSSFYRITAASTKEDRLFCLRKKVCNLAHFFCIFINRGVKADIMNANLRNIRPFFKFTFCKLNIAGNINKNRTRPAVKGNFKSTWNCFQQLFR